MICRRIFGNFFPYALRRRDRGLAACEENEGKHVLECIFAAFDACLGLGVAVQPPQDEPDLRFDFLEVGFRLLVVDGGAEHEAVETGYLG